MSNAVMSAVDQDMLAALKHVRQHFLCEISDLESVGNSFLPRIRMVGARVMVEYLDAAIKKAEAK